MYTYEVPKIEGSFLSFEEPSSVIPKSATEPSLLQHQSMGGHTEDCCRYKYEGHAVLTFAPSAGWRATIAWLIPLHTAGAWSIPLRTW